MSDDHTTALILESNDDSLDHAIDEQADVILAMLTEFTPEGSQAREGFVITPMSEENVIDIRQEMVERFPDDVYAFDIALSRVKQGYPSGEFCIGDTYVIVGNTTAALRQAIDQYEKDRSNPN